MKIWFQNRRVKHKKEEGGPSSVFPSNGGQISPSGSKCRCSHSGCSPKINNDSKEFIKQHGNEIKSNADVIPKHEATSNESGDEEEGASSDSCGQFRSAASPNRKQELLLNNSNKLDSCRINVDSKMLENHLNAKKQFVQLSRCWVLVSTRFS